MVSTEELHIFEGDFFLDREGQKIPCDLYDVAKEYFSSKLATFLKFTGYCLVLRDGQLIYGDNQREIIADEEDAKNTYMQFRAKADYFPHADFDGKVCLVKLDKPTNAQIKSCLNITDLLKTPCDILCAGRTIRLNINTTFELAKDIIANAFSNNPDDDAKTLVAQKKLDRLFESLSVLVAKPKCKETSLEIAQWLRAYAWAAEDDIYPKLDIKRKEVAKILADNGYMDKYITSGYSMYQYSEPKGLIPPLDIYLMGAIKDVAKVIESGDWLRKIKPERFSKVDNMFKGIEEVIENDAKFVINDKAAFEARDPYKMISPEKGWYEDFAIARLESRGKARPVELYHPILDKPVLITPYSDFVELFKKSCKEYWDKEAAAEKIIDDKLAICTQTDLVRELLENDFDKQGLMNWVSLFSERFFRDGGEVLKLMDGYNEDTIAGRLKELVGKFKLKLYEIDDKDVAIKSVNPPKKIAEIGLCESDKIVQSRLSRIIHSLEAKYTKNPDAEFPDLQLKCEDGDRYLVSELIAFRSVGSYYQLKLQEEKIAEQIGIER